MHLIKAFLICIFIMTLAVPAVAQTEIDSESLQRRLELAEKYHEIFPAKDEVESAIDKIAARLPETERESFKLSMRNILNYKAIEKISIDAMADNFTEEELAALVEYYSKPEAITAIEAKRKWADQVGPEIMRMLDQAMMRVRTGASGQ